LTWRTACKNLFAGAGMGDLAKPVCGSTAPLGCLDFRAEKADKELG
jgi:hypothetical protein